MSRVDYFSLDCEGCELLAVRSIDFAAVAVDVFTIEGSPEGHALCGHQSFEAAPFRGELMLFRRHFLDARRGGAERIRLVQAGAESVTTWPTYSCRAA